MKIKKEKILTYFLAMKNRTWGFYVNSDKILKIQ